MELTKQLSVTFDPLPVKISNDKCVKNRLKKSF